MINNYKAGHIQRLVERGDELFSEYMKSLYALDASGVKNSANIAAALRARGNEGAATYMESPLTKSLLNLS